MGTHVYEETYKSPFVITEYDNPYHEQTTLNLVPGTENPAISAPVPAEYSSQTPVKFSSQTSSKKICIYGCVNL